MNKVLVILPSSIGGEKVLKGFAEGFKANGCFVKIKDIRALKVSDIVAFKPNVIFGYDYGFLYSDDEQLKNYIIENQHKITLIHYFADIPNEKFACVNKPALYDEFKKINAISYIWDKSYINQLPNCKYMPMAINYKSYRSAEDKKYEISFVGRPLTDKRQEILSLLIKTYGKKVKLFCYEKHFLQSLVEIKKKNLLNDEELEIYKKSYCGYLQTEQDLANVFYNSTVNINVTIQGDSGLNHRIFAVLASRGFLLTDDVKDLHDYFEIGKELEVYKSESELVDKISFYLKNTEIAQKIGLLGFANVTKKHNYTARVNKMLCDLKSYSK